jgi:hypothetical protein
VKIDDTAARILFIAAMAMLGAALALAVIRNPGFFSSKPTPASRHHTLDSPYGGNKFDKGQLQGQTNTALGRAFPVNLANSYKALGYEWLAVTDLNTITPTNRYTVAGVEPLLGTDAGYSFGHFLAIGVDTLGEAASPQAAVDWIHADAGAAIVARPLQPPAMDYQTIADLKGLDGIQILDARLIKDDPIHADATELWDRLLTDHHIVWGMVGDDSLDNKGPDSVVGQTSIDVQVESLTAPLIEDALKRGAFVDSAGVRVLSVSNTSDTITVVTTNADTITFIGSGGKVLKTVKGTRGDYKVDWSEGYVRVLATTDGGGKAWTQPIVVNP